MQTISINFIVLQGWHELSDKQLRYVYQLLADNFATDDKSCQREQSQARLDYAECSRFCWEEIKTFACSSGAAQRLSVGKTAGLISSKKQRFFLK